MSALVEALELGYGIETDIRDHFGEVVISHDPVAKLEADRLEVLLGQLEGRNSPVALNVKSDGLLSLLPKDRLRENTFFFDMSIPEKVQYERNGLIVASRLSELESVDSQNSGPVWLDSFESDWFLEEDSWNSVLKISEERLVVIVSPELHSRSPEAVWLRFQNGVNRSNRLSICTDWPERVERS